MHVTSFAIDTVGPPVSEGEATGSPSLPGMGSGLDWPPDLFSRPVQRAASTDWRQVWAGPGRETVAEMPEEPIEATHILFRATQGDAASFARAEARATATLGMVATRLDRFEALARTLSDCPSAAAGGRLGKVAPAQVGAAFFAALKALAPGELAPVPLCTPYGLHLVRRELTRRDNRPPPDNRPLAK